MEKIDIKSSTSVVKVSGTMVAILGAMVFMSYQGPLIFYTIPHPDSTYQFLSSQPSNWLFGGLVIIIGGTFNCICSVLQSTRIVFFYCLFGTIQCMALSPFLELDGNAWVLQSVTGVTAVILGAVYSTIGRNGVLTWCLGKKGPVFVAMFSPLAIIIAMITGVAFLGDSLHLGR
ncbi:hypothetical protein Hanom_Chr17g01553561 [Helianthus anomalus]